MAITYEWRGEFTSAEANLLHAECFGHRVQGDEEWDWRGQCPDGEQRQAGQELLLCCRAREAADRAAGAETTRIEGDKVETRPQFGRDLRIGG